MKTEINSINIIPAIFVGYRKDGNALIKCLQDEGTIDRAFEPHMVQGIKKPKYLLISIMTGKNMMQLTMKDGSEFENLFHEKWDVLLK